MPQSDIYDVAIVGGGLAGLAASIVCAKRGMRVILFEKERYPFHKVCGEYISLESKPFLLELGLPIDQMQLPIIDTLELSAPSGRSIVQRLPLGGVGVSRYRIDNELATIAREHKVVISEGDKVQDISFDADLFNIVSDNEKEVRSKLCFGSFGKRSNLDVKWQRPFIQRKAGVLNNFIAVKYHSQMYHPRNLISLHNFKGGYCGISPVEENRACICYLTTAQNLRESNNSIAQMEERVLSRNPYLKDLFQRARMIYEKPLTISQISFHKKEQVMDHVLLIGDAAGLITPLCGNGMSMALHAARLACECAQEYFSGKINRMQLESQFTAQWKAAFSKRLRAGRMIQSLFGREWITNNVIKMLKPFPGIISSIIRQTHGGPV